MLKQLIKGKVYVFIDAENLFYFYCERAFGESQVY